MPLLMQVLSNGRKWIHEVLGTRDIDDVVRSPFVSKEPRWGPRGGFGSETPGERGGQSSQHLPGEQTDLADMSWRAVDLPVR
jgi:hypothetical protein